MTNKNVQMILFGIGAVIAIRYLASNQIARFNEGTEFEDTGVIGALGNVTDQASGGILSAIGSSIGEFFSGSFFDRRTLDDLTGT